MMKPYRKSFGLWVPDRSLSDNRGFISPGLVGAVAGARRRTTVADYTDGLTMWLKASTISGNDGDAVGESGVRPWNDSAGSYNWTQGTAANRPLLKTGANGINGQNTVLFDGSNDRLVSSAPSSTATFTLLVVFVPDASDAYASVFTQGGTAGLYYRGSTVKKASFYNSSTDQQWTTQLTEGTAYLLSLQAYGTGWKAYLNGALDRTLVTVPGAFSGDTMGDNAAGETFKGKISEIRFWANQTVSDANRKIAEAYLGNLYGLTITP